MSGEKGRVAVIILAAGNSTRMGHPKQLLVTGGMTLIRQLGVQALSADVGPVVVITGASHSEVQEALDGLGVICVHNPEWAEGIGSSVRTAVKYIQDTQPPLSAVIIMLGDQPFADALLIKKLVDVSHKTGASVVTCDYGDNTGPPTFFGQKHFAELLNLSGDQGAKKVVQSHSAAAEYVPFRLGKLDLDTPSDYEAYLKMEKNKYHKT